MLKEREAKRRMLKGNRPRFWQASLNTGALCLLSFFLVACDLNRDTSVEDGGDNDASLTSDSLESEKSRFSKDEKQDSENAIDSTNSIVDVATDENSRESRESKSLDSEKRDEAVRTRNDDSEQAVLISKESEEVRSVIRTADADSSDHDREMERSYSQSRDVTRLESDGDENRIADASPDESIDISGNQRPEDELSATTLDNDSVNERDGQVSDSSDYQVTTNIALTIKEAKWEDDDNKLKIEGKASPGQEVTVFDTSSLAYIASAAIDSSGEWELKVRNLETPPCSVTVETNNASVSVNVEDVPLNCGFTVGDADVVTPNPNPLPQPDPIPSLSNVQVFAFNDLGMHCMDEDYSVFSVLPPFNVLHAQVIQKGNSSQKPKILNASQVDVQYSPTPDSSGSVNSTSIGKTNFWDHVQALFGMSPAPDTGLLGLKMPSADNGDQSFPDFDANQQMFTAAGIPITPIDDAGVYNPYPLLKVSVMDKSTGAMMSSLDVTTPVSTEMNCYDCHYTGNIAADEATAVKYTASPIAWSTSSNPVVEYKENILLLHDAKHNTSLINSQPVLCADCHYSPALDLAGAGPQGKQLGVSMMSQAVHGRHGMTIDGNLPDTSSPAVISDAGKEACYNCHPGKKTQCFRGAMFSAGLSCQNCHGGLLAVAGQFPLADGSKRQPWIDLPQCQSCHTGDANSHLGSSIILSSAFAAGDNSAEPIIASNKRFAEQDNTLYRNSKGHGGVACEACHGSTHAIWPVSSVTSNDNVAAIQLQGHAGFISECKVCHESGSLPLTLSGPHGMHNVGDSRWNQNHESFYERNSGACKACHGRDLRGTVLSKMGTDRVLQSDRRQADGTRNIRLAKGTPVACDLCHEMP